MGGLAIAAMKRRRGQTEPSLSTSVIEEYVLLSEVMPHEMQCTGSFLRLTVMHVGCGGCLESTKSRFVDIDDALELISFTGAKTKGSDTKGWGRTKRANIVKDVLSMIGDAPRGVLFDIVDDIYRKASPPDTPSLKLMKEVFDVSLAYSRKIRVPGSHNTSEHHRTALAVTRMCTSPSAESGKSKN